MIRFGGLSRFEASALVQWAVAPQPRQRLDTPSPHSHPVSAAVELALRRVGTNAATTRVNFSLLPVGHVLAQAYRARRLLPLPQCSSERVAVTEADADAKLRWHFRARDMAVAGRKSSRNPVVVAAPPPERQTPSMELPVLLWTVADWANSRSTEVIYFTHARVLPKIILPRPSRWKSLWSTTTPSRWGRCARCAAWTGSKPRCD